ncbi:cytochrome P450 4d2-like [Pectinophora gossypiella]|uniref:cytochrome P450 4d2-like n=1 Tax=Pectinophora gossypiella TaxID=13191 RepID=UPI00214F1455|nr:cytochrome P450 4d2-like [Pectinophora gossypiella]
MWERHGKRSFRVSVGSEDWVLLSEPDDVAVLFSDSSILSKSPERNAAVKPFFGNSVSTSEGERWRWARKLVLSSFNMKNMQQRLNTVNSRSDVLLKILSNYDGKGPVPLYQYLRPFMLDILFNTLMGVDSNFLENPNHPYLIESGKVIHMITENYFSYWRNIRPIFALTSTYREQIAAIKTIQETGSNVIRQRKSKLKKIIDDVKLNNRTVDVDVHELIQKRLSEDNTLLDTYLLKTLPNGDPVPDDVINEEISFIYFTGHFTTAVTISHALYCLAKNPEIQNKVLEEQRSIFNTDFLRKPTMQDLNEMKYLEAAIKETLRVIPTVPKIGRKLNKDMTMRDGRVIPAGTTVIVYYEAMFVNEKVFPEPHKFSPERFFENNIQSHAFLPFGGGPRSCIGFRFAWMAVKAALSNILRRYEVLEGGPGTEPQFSYRIVTESKNGINVKLSKR